MTEDIQPTSHPLKWKYLLDNVKRCGLENPDVYIEDVRRYGPCQRDGGPISATTLKLDMSEEVDYLEASFSTIINVKKNFIIIRHHY